MNPIKQLQRQRKYITIRQQRRNAQLQARIALEVARMAVISTCAELTLDRFETAKKGDLKALIRDGLVDVQQSVLSEAWVKILDEYASIDNSDELSYIEALQRRELYLNIKITVSEQYLLLLEHSGYDESYIAALREFGHIADFPEDNPEKFKRGIAEIRAWLRKDMNELQKVKDDIVAFNEKNSGEKETDFDAMLVIIEKGLGIRFPLSKFEITVAKYVNYVNQLRKTHKPSE